MNLSESYKKRIQELAGLPVHKTSISLIIESYEDVGIEWVKNKRPKLSDVSDNSNKKETKNFTLFQNKLDDTQGLITAFDNEDGTEVGNSYYRVTPSGLKSTVDVRPDMRRKGIATEMYKYIEELTGRKLTPDLPHSNKAKQFWSQPNRSFGEDWIDKDYLSEIRNRKPEIKTVYHGTSLKKAAQIKLGGLQAGSMGYQSASWYMVSTDFASALFHATAENGEQAPVIEFEVPVDNSKWEGYPYFWPPYERNANSKWFALKEPLPAKFIKKVTYVSYEDFLKQKDKRF